MNRERVKSLFADVSSFVVGSSLFAVSVNVFSAPNSIAPGGATGLATVIHSLTGLPIGVLILLINLPLFLISIKSLGWKFLVRTVVATVISSVLIDVSAAFLPPYQGDTLLAALYGGFLSGLGLGLIFLRGATTGGSDLGAKLISIKFPNISIGKLILFIDLAVIVIATAVYGSFESALYALIMVFISGTLIDKVVYGSGTGKQIIIVSEHNGVIADRILHELKRGVTILKAQGAYTGNSRQVLLCAVRRQELFEVRTLVRQEDENAFLLVSDVGEIIGEGFNEADNE